MVDIHCHILPGVDDGAVDLGMTADMLDEAKSLGIDTIVATSHIDYRFEKAYFDHIMKVYPEVETLAQEKGIELHLGAEIFHHDDNLKLITENPQFHLGNNAKYLLVETGFIEKPFEFKHGIFDLLMHGKKVVFAHPERYRWLSEDTDSIDYLQHSGVLFQLDAGSINGVFSKRAENFAWELIDNGLAHSVASDAHNLSGRSFRELERARELVTERKGEETAKILFEENNRAIVDGRDEIKRIPVTPRDKNFLEMMSDFFKLS